MDYKIIFIFFIFSIMGVGYSMAQEEYQDTFDSNLINWEYKNNSWLIKNETVVSLENGYPLIFKNFNGNKYIMEIDVYTNDDAFSEVHIYFYYKDSDNYGRIYFADDDRSSEYIDRYGLPSKGVEFVDTTSYVKILDNRSIELYPAWKHIKIVRLNKIVYAYFDGKLFLTTKFKNENPPGKVGLFVYQSTGYFDNFHLRPIEMENASGYIDDLKLNSSHPTVRLGLYSLGLVGVSSEGAVFTLSKFGKIVDRVIVSEGEVVSMSFEDGSDGVEFRLVEAMNGSTGGMVELEEIIYAESESLSPHIENLTIEPSYYRGEMMTVGFSVVNPGGVVFRGVPEITINSEGGSVSLSPELDLGANESRNFSVELEAAKTPGRHRLTVAMKLDEYNTVTKSVDYTVRALNPVVTELSPDLREDGGIRGTVTIGSAFSDALVDWNTTARVEVFRVLENGKERVYQGEVPVKGKTFTLGIPYNGFYRGDGRYLVTLQVGEMENDRFFEVKGPDGEYRPLEGEVVPPTVASDSVYPQLMLLLLGMVAALSVRNHLRPGSWSLPLDFVAAGCGSVIFAAGLALGQTEMVTRGMLLAGAGFMLVIAREHDQRVNTLLMRGSPIHDFIGLVLIFLSASYLTLLLPEKWNTMVALGTLITYYTLINLHGERVGG